MTKNDTYPIEAPGVFIREELEARGWLQADLAYILGVQVQAVNALLNDKKGISTAMAKKLGVAFDVEAQFFINLQNEYDLYRAEEPSNELEKRAQFQQQYPLRDMIKRGWLQESSADLLEEQMNRFFMVDSSDSIPHMDHAAKKSSMYGDDLPAPQLAWLFRAHHVASSSYVESYNRDKLVESVDLLSNLRQNPEEIRHVPRILSESGVRFVLIECLPKSKIDGACFWIDGDSPVIAMSLRFDRLDNFWFVLRHEIEHVIQGHGQGDSPIIDIDMESEKDNLPEEEVVANNAAADFCVPQDKMNSFFLRKSPYIAELDVASFSERMLVHPALVVGQIHHRNKRFQTFRKHLVKIKKYILPSALVDGWGEIAPIDL